MHPSGPVIEIEAFNSPQWLKKGGYSKSEWFWGKLSF